MIRRMKKNIERGNSFAFICQDINDLEHSAQMKLPRVSVVMPLKGFGEHNLQNWRSQVRSENKHSGFNFFALHFSEKTVSIFSSLQSLYCKHINHNHTVSRAFHKKVDTSLSLKIK